VKLFAWESLFETKVVRELRDREADKLWKFALMQQLNAALSLSTPALTLLAMLWVRELTLGDKSLVDLLFSPSSSSATSPPLSLATIFTAVALVGILQAPLSGVSDGLAALAQAMVGLGRLKRFLILDEITPQLGNNDKNDKGMGDPSSAAAAVLFGSWVFANQQTRKTQQAQPRKLPALEHNSPPFLPPALAEQKVAVAAGRQGITIPRGKLIVVCGPTGAGKSAFLLGLLGELEPIVLDDVGGGGGCREAAQLSGEDKRKGANDCLVDADALVVPWRDNRGGGGSGGSSDSLLSTAPSLDISSPSVVQRLCDTTAFVPQDAFIFNGSLRDNVIFFHDDHSTSGDDRYAAALKASALMEDLSALPAGDQTEVGSKGLNLSGGQKQRLSMARALYSGADLLLLDDPLSAVDAHVAKYLWEKAIKPLVADNIDGDDIHHSNQAKKTVVLVTSNLALVARDPAVHEIIVIDQGRVVSRGSFEKLVGFRDNATNSEGCAVFRRLLESFSAALPQQAQSPALPSLEMEGRQAEQGSGLENLTDNVDGNNAIDEDAAKHGSLALIDDISGGKIAAEEGASPNEPPSPSRIEAGAVLTGVESRHSGAVRSASYFRYFCSPSKSGDSNCWGLFVVCGALALFPLCEGLNTLQSYWLARKAQQLQQHENQDDDDGGDSGDDGENEDDTRTQVISSSLVLVYGVLVGATFACLCFRALLFSTFVAQSSSKLHAQALKGVLRSPMSFFDTTPAGRILNRFANDQDDVDSALPLTMASFFVEAFKVVGVLTLATLAVPPFAAVVPFIAYVFVGITERYRRSSREVQRLLAVSRSPLFTVVEEALTGLVTIRAFKVDGRRRRQSAMLSPPSSPTSALSSAPSSFQELFDERVGKSTSWAYMKLALDQWLLARLSLVSAMVVTSMAVFMVSLPILNRRVFHSSAFELNTAVASLALAFSVQLVPVLRFAVRYATDSEAKFNAVDRLLEFSDLPPEGGGCIDLGQGRNDDEFCRSGVLGEDQPAEGQSTTMRRGGMMRGSIEVQNLFARHRPHLPLVLKGVTFNVNCGEHVGIVGRTGSGKSSLGLALVRLIEPFTTEGAGINFPSALSSLGTATARRGVRSKEHSAVATGRPIVLLDGIDTKALSLHALRRAIAVVPQDAVLFRGTVRSNLDPFNEHSDADLWTALAQAELTETVKNLSPPPLTSLSTFSSASPASVASSPPPVGEQGGGGLYSDVQGGGSNFSSGQRQLFCLARAVLRLNPQGGTRLRPANSFKQGAGNYSGLRVLLLDEATATVDTATDACLQRMLRREFSGVTVLAIAHRLETILDSDKVLVLHEGRVAEFDSPNALLANPSGKFRGMFDASST